MSAVSFWESAKVRLMGQVDGSKRREFCLSQTLARFLQYFEDILNTILVNPIQVASKTVGIYCGILCRHSNLAAPVTGTFYLFLLDLIILIHFFPFFLFYQALLQVQTLTSHSRIQINLRLLANFSIVVISNSLWTKGLSHFIQGYFWLRRCINLYKICSFSL